MKRTLILMSLMAALMLVSCGAAETGTQSVPTPNEASAAPAVAYAEAEAPATPSAPSASEAADAKASVAAEVDAKASVAAEEEAETSSTLGIGEAIDLAASAIAAASAANAAAGPSDDGCPSAMTPANPELASLAAEWNPGGTISVRGGLDVPLDSILFMFTFQDGTEVGWAQFGSFGSMDVRAEFDQTSTIPKADDIIYGEMAKGNPYRPGSLVCVGLTAIRGDVSLEDMSDPAKRDEALLARVRLPVRGEAPAEITLP